MYQYLQLMGRLGLLLLLGWACSPPTPSTPTAATGRWRFVLQLGPEVELPFMAELSRQGEGYGLVIQNADERLPVDTVLRHGDSLYIRLAVFDSEFQGKMVDSTHLAGVWRDYSRGEDYAIPFTASRTDGPRFSPQKGAAASLAARYQATFSPGTEDSYPAVGSFTQTGAQVSGSFLTETGDYRYLEGVVAGQQLRLSAFDGSHAFLFVGDIAGDSLQGTFYSGTHWREPWAAVADPQAALRDPETLTYLAPGYDALAFRFANADGEDVALSDPRYQGKVVIVQLLGSWCPNCMDETRLFAQWYDRYHEQGLEIIGLAFERAKEPAQAWRSLDRMQAALDVHYDILLASTSPSKADASAALPMLNQVMSFPTSIYLDRQGRVRKIHTGFYGPGTGAPYLRFVEQYEGLLETLLAEPEE
jgi:thiol-disulfide isomerase/thioredoxin